MTCPRIHRMGPRRSTEHQGVLLPTLGGWKGSEGDTKIDIYHNGSPVQSIWEESRRVIITHIPTGIQTEGRNRQEAEEELGRKLEGGSK